VPIRFTSFPRTLPPPKFITNVISAFQSNDARIGLASAEKGFGSDRVLQILADELKLLGFDVESSKKAAGKIYRPVFFGEGGKPSLRYEVDAYNLEFRCGLEVEAGRGFQGGAFYRDLIQAMVMSEVDHLCIAILNRYEYASTYSNDYSKAIDVADALFAHDRIRIPFGLTVIGYGPV
jgi:hypothetical protein